MRIEPENNSVSIVLVGSLNPAIFHPAWFVANDLLGKDVLESATIEIIHKEIAAFKIGDWLRIQVEPLRFIAETTEPPFVRLSDLVVKTFREALLHTPIYQMGINRRVHFSVGDEETRNKIGKKLAPQEVWGEWGKCIEGKTPTKRGGVASITMKQEELDDRETGHIQAKVEPSTLVRNASGISVDVNDHYEIPKDDSLGATKMMDILRTHFEGSIQRSEWIIDQVMALKEQV